MSALIATWALPALLMLMAGLVSGFAAGLFGIGGGFVVVPVLFIMLPLLGGSEEGIAHAAIGTSLATIGITALRSVQAHARRDAVDFELLKAWAPWIVLGVGAGVVLASRISGNLLALIFGVGVGLMSLHFLFPTLNGMRLRDDMPGGYVRAGIAGGLGVFSSLLGIGGGTIAIIVMTLCGKSIHRSIATAAGIGFIIAVPGTIGFIVIGLSAPGLPFGSIGYVNLIAALAIVSTSIISAPLGAAVAHRLPAAVLNPIFGLYLLFVSAMMIRHALI